MVNQNVLTTFIALTSVAVLIQTGIVIGLYFVTSKITRQADQVLNITRSFVAPVQNLTDNLQTVSARVAEFGEATQGQLRHFDEWWRKRRSA